MKKTVWVLSVFIVLTIGIIFWHFFTNSPENLSEMTDLIPPGAVFLVETDEPVEAWEQIRDNPFWKALLQTPGFEDYQSLQMNIDDFFKNKTYTSLVEGLPMLMSAHITAGNDWDFLFVIDLKHAVNIEDLLKLAGKGFRYKRHSLNGKNYWKIPTGPNQNLYLYSEKNLVVFSFSYQILRQSLLDRNQGIKHRLSFDLVYEKTPSRVLRVFLNYSEWPRFLALYFNNRALSTFRWTERLSFTGLGLKRDGKYLLAKGITTVDTIPSYFKAFLKIDPGKQNALSVLPEQTAYYVSFGFDDFYDFMSSVRNVYFKSKPDMRRTLKSQEQQLKRLLKIDLDRDLYGWIGHEIAVAAFDARYRDNYVLLLHTNNPSKAMARLEYMAEQIRKKTPFKFKSYKYKNFKINYLHQKNFFKFLLGDMLKNIKEPYFTMIDNYVVFAASDAILKQMIDAYTEARTVEKSETEANFLNFSPEEHNFSLYINMTYFYPLLQNMLTETKAKTLNRYEKLWRSLSQAELKFKSNGQYFDTYLNAEHDSTAFLRYQLLRESNTDDETLYYATIENLSQTLPTSGNRFDEGKISLRDKEGNLLAEGMAHNGKPQGLWRFYFSSGNIRMSVPFENGIIDGEVIVYYNKEKPVPQLKVTFNDGRPDGKCIEYRPNGVKKAQCNYKKGKKNGKAYFYYPDGSIKIEGHYKQNRKRGKWIFYDREGNKKAKIRF